MVNTVSSSNPRANPRLPGARPRRASPMGVNPTCNQRVLLTWIFLGFFLNFRPLASIPPVSAEFTYGYETDEYTLAFLNLTYIDPATGQLRSTKEEVGKFSVGRVEAVSGLVVHATSANHTRHDGCGALDSDIIPQGEPWIALIEYGNCGEGTKLRNAVNSNASAALVYNDKQGQRLIKMNHRVFQIVSVFISKEKGEELLTLLDNGTRVMMHITVGSRNTFRYANINRTSVLFVSISFIILMIISLAWLVFYYVQRFRYIHAKDLLARRLCSAAKKALDKISVKTIRSGDREAEGDFECCAVCIEPFKVGEVVRMLPCKHTFHKSCVDPWLLEQRSCPMCKMDILKYYGLVFSGSQESVLNIDENDLGLHHGQAEVEILHHVPLHMNQPDTPSHHSQHRHLHPSMTGTGSTGSSSGAEEDSRLGRRLSCSPLQSRSPQKIPSCVSPLPLLPPTPTLNLPKIVTSDISVIEGNLISPLGVPSAIRDSPILPPQQPHQHRRWGSAPPGAPIDSCARSNGTTFGSTNVGGGLTGLSPAAFCAIDLTGNVNGPNQAPGSLETLSTSSPNQVQIGKKHSLPNSDLGLPSPTPPLAHQHM